MKTPIKKTVFTLIIICFAMVYNTFAQQRDVVVIKRNPKKNVIYVNPSPNVRVVRAVPSEARIIHFRNIPYYFHAGLYYNFIGGRYVVVAPLRGLRVSILPPHYFYFRVSGISYYYLEGVYYAQKGKELEVTQAPVGALVPKLPHEAEKVTIEGKIFYEFDNTIYKRIETNQGFQYEVVGEK